MEQSSNKIYICIPVHNRIQYTLACLRSIYSQTYNNFVVIVCDDGSIDNTSNILKERYPDVVLLKGNGSLWWTGGINKCVEYALKNTKVNDFVYTLNNDTELFDNTLENLVLRAKEYPNSIIGTVNLFYNEPRKIEPSAFRKRNKFPFKKRIHRIDDWGSLLNNRNCAVEVDSLSGKGVLIPIPIFKRIGLYNFDMLPHYHADSEFTLRAKKNNYTIYFDYNSRLLSHQNLSGIGTRTSQPNLKEFIQSFFIIKSAHHFPTLVNKAKLIYGKKYIIYLILDLIFIIAGFLKRTIRELI